MPHDLNNDKSTLSLVIALAPSGNRQQTIITWTELLYGDPNLCELSAVPISVTMLQRRSDGTLTASNNAHTEYHEIILRITTLLHGTPYAAPQEIRLMSETGNVTP